MAQTGPASGAVGAPAMVATVTAHPGPRLPVGANLTPNVTRKGRNAERVPVVEADASADSGPEAAPAADCAGFPTWYDAQLVLESSVDDAVIAALDPDGDAIACEEVMYPDR